LADKPKACHDGLGAAGAMVTVIASEREANPLMVVLKAQWRYRGLMVFF